MVAAKFQFSHSMLCLTSDLIAYDKRCGEDAIDEDKRFNRVCLTFVLWGMMALELQWTDPGYRSNKIATANGNSYCTICVLR